LFKDFSRSQRRKASEYGVSLGLRVGKKVTYKRPAALRVWVEVELEGAKETFPIQGKS